MIHHYDITSAKAAMAALATNMAAIKPYVRAMQGFSLGPQSLGEGASWDPLGSMPSVETALGSVQSHCSTAQFFFVDALGAYPGPLAKAVGAVGEAGIINDFTSINAVLDVLPDSAGPTPEQRQTVESR